MEHLQNMVAKRLQFTAVLDSLQSILEMRVDILRFKVFPHTVLFL